MSEISKEKDTLFKEICGNVSIIYKGQEITNEDFLKQYVNYVSDCLFRDKHNILITQHNGSEIYDAIMLVSIVMAVLVTNSLTPQSVITLLEKGQWVTSGNKQERMEYLGKSEREGYYEFKPRESNARVYVTEKSFTKIVPYYGNAKELGKRGAGDQHSSLMFQKEVLGYDDSQATSFSDTSVVIVADHGYFDDLMNGIIIHYGERDYKILELLAVSFFTDENETIYSGNPNKIEANLKVTRTMSTARDLLFNQEGNEIIGFCALGLAGVRNTVAELEEALKRKKLLFSSINYDISEDENALYGLMMEDNLPGYNLYSCTKDFLLSYYLGLSSDKGVLKTFDDYNNRIIDKEIKSIKVESTISDKELYNVYRLLGTLRKQTTDDNVIKFVILCNDLLKILLAAIVPMKEFEDKEGIDIDYVTPGEKLKELKSFEGNLGSISQYTANIIPYIEKLYKQLYDSSPKANYLCGAVDRSHRTIIVVDKAYYRPIIQRYYAKRGLHGSFTTNTESKAKGVSCDELYVVGKGTSSSILDWNNAAVQNYVLYDGEYGLFAWKFKKYKEKMSLFNKMSYYDVDTDDEIEEQTIEEYENEVANEMDSISDLEQRFMIQNAILRSSSFSGEVNSVPAKVTRVAVCETGESIYFTEYFKALVLDLENNQVNEVETKNIKNGDSIIFTINNGQTKDIAELVMSRFAKSRKNEQLITAMADVEAWKSHLNIIRQEKQYTYGQMASLFKKYGYNVTAQTVRTWIDTDCHVVGPLKDEAYFAMADIFRFEDILSEFVDNPKRFIEATNMVRSQRRRILDFIGEVIVAKYTGRDVKLDQSFDKVITQEIAELAVLKRITQIRDVDVFTIPGARANKPIVM